MMIMMMMMMMMMTRVVLPWYPDIINCDYWRRPAVKPKLSCN
jgi:hypothetical protein